jgi:hypothetical protein
MLHRDGKNAELKHAVEKEIKALGVELEESMNEEFDRMTESNFQFSIQNTRKTSI